MKKNNIPIFFAVDDNYAKFLAVTLSSLEEYASKDYEYKIYILNTGLSLASKKLLNQFKKGPFKIIYYNMTLKLCSVDMDMSVRDYYSKTTYYRLLIPTLFPSIDKALYLDCDIVINEDISKLYNIDIKNNLVGAAIDSSVLKINEFRYYVENALGISYDHYFNAGILIMNFKEMRAQYFEQQVIELLYQFSFEVAQDQDVLNIICKNQVTYIPTCWNQMPFGERNENPSLIHYNLCYKPWKLKNVMYEEYFYDFATKAGVLNDILKAKEQFDEEKQKKEQEGLKRLMKLCVILGDSKDNYYNTIRNQYLEGRLSLWK